MPHARPSWFALACVAVLLAALTGTPPTALPAATGSSDGVAIRVAATADATLALPPTGSPAQLLAQPAKRLPWSPAEPVRWSALLLVVLTTLAFGAVTVAGRAWRWCPFVWRAPPAAAVA
ncbi:MAG TPA: hypothetical protein VKP64_15445 [Mycobacteriales bacterium]|nr:hypothetical protein [Mycobacteriales bacterium]